MEYFLLLVFCPGLYGFLWDTNTSIPTRAPLLTDSHFNVLMTLLHDERQSRIQLENYVKQMQQDMTATKQGMYMQVLQSINSTFEARISGLVHENDQLKTNNKNMQVLYESLKYEVELLKRKQNQTITENTAIQLQQEISSLKQLQSVANLYSVTTLTNKTNKLEKELQATNSRLVTLTSDANARKQDFQALFTKADATENKLQNKTQLIEIELQRLDNKSERERNETIATQIINDRTVKKMEYKLQVLDQNQSEMNHTITAYHHTHSKVRLQAEMKGRLEIKHNGAWGTVCDDGFNNNDAIVACRSLGFSGSATFYTVGGGSGSIWLRHVNCKGHESSLSQCLFEGWGTQNCGHDEDVGIICSYSY